MRQRPKRLFRARRRGAVLYVGPAEHHDPPHYLDAVMALEAKLQPGEVRTVTIAHDNWCQHWQGKGCNCNPNIRLGEPIQ